MDIKKVLRSLKCCYHDWSKYIINPNYIQNENIVTWANRKSRRNRLSLRLSDVHKMEAEGQYTYIVEVDHSIIQLFYRFDSKMQHLTGASLAYYSTAHESQYYDSQLMEFGVIPYGEGVESEYMGDGDDSAYGPEVGWFRFDFDPGAETLDVTHSLCHIHFSGFPNARLIVSGVPSPRQFVEFVFCSFYPDVYREHRFELTNVQEAGKVSRYRESNVLERINRDQLLYEDDRTYRHIVHFRVPDKH